MWVVFVSESQNVRVSASELSLTTAQKKRILITTSIKKPKARTCYKLAYTKGNAKRLSVWLYHLPFSSLSFRYPLSTFKTFVAIKTFCLCVVSCLILWILSEKNVLPFLIVSCFLNNALVSKTENIRTLPFFCAS